MTSAVVADSYGTGTSPPRWPLLLSVVVLFLATFLGFVAWNSSQAWLYDGVGWFGATWISEGSFIAYRLVDRRRRARPDYVTNSVEKPLFGVVTVLCLLVGVWHAYWLALWWAS
ncbi:hypothetical protein [Lentzea sp. NPDC059081]|uniref:hypothetical protein n=1 Tax=Lentzea sp. NPDC059081 TaxID=3346719 RepID=UPI0036CF2CE5